MKKLNLIFPVAGEASRFGGTFKPFLNIGDITFIETTFEPFKKWSEHIATVYFICTEKQEELFDVTDKMKNIIDHDKVEVLIIKNKTEGPYQTISQGIANDVKGPAIVCDCDHTLNVDNIFNEYIKGGKFDAIIPTWDIRKDEYANWSKLLIGNRGIEMICEKEKIESDTFIVKGIIGCILFNNIQSAFSNEGIYVSDSLKDLLKNNKVLKSINTQFAEFYGDEEMLKNFVNKRRKQCTIFCDIDGVLLKHKPHSTCISKENKILKGAEKLDEFKKSGHKVILTTARNNKFRKCTIKMLSELNINYDELVMSLPAGPRILINDHKPSKIFSSQSNAIELTRNEGLGSVEIDKYTKQNDIEITKIFPGGSFAKTYLLSDFVRKHIVKSEENEIHYEKLKRQKNDLIRFDFLWEGSTPKIIGEKDNDYDYYFDMEYLEGYETISNTAGFERFNALDKLFNGMNDNVYSMKKEIEGIGWVNNFLKKKIYPKFKIYEKNEHLKTLIYSKSVFINGIEYKGLKEIILNIDKHTIKPKHIRPIHGDFTFENIMWNGEDIKLIDMDGSDSFDAAELDLGKMCQSVYSRFNDWKNIEMNVGTLTGNRFTCNDNYFDIEKNSVYEIVENRWSRILNDDGNTIKTKGIFYMCMWFIRFVPFRMKQSEDHGIFALIMAIVWLSKITGDKND